MNEQTIFHASFLGLDNIRVIKDLSVCQEPFITLADIARVLDYYPRNLRAIIQRDPGMFEDVVYLGVVTTPRSDTRKGYKKRQICLTEEGIYGLLMVLNSSRIKDPTKRQRIVAFRRWARRTLYQIIKGEIPDVCVPSAIQDLIKISSAGSKIRRAAVRKIAGEKRVHERTVYRMINRAREQAHLPKLKKSPSTKGTHINVKEFNLLKSILPRNSGLAAHVIKELFNLTYSIVTINRIKRQLFMTVANDRSTDKTQTGSAGTQKAG